VRRAVAVVVQTPELTNEPSGEARGLCAARLSSERANLQFNRSWASLMAPRGPRPARPEVPSCL
jgi:hypothetical protein